MFTEREIDMKKTFLSLVLCMALMMSVQSFAIVEGTNKTIKVNTKIYDELDSYDEVDYFTFKLSKPGSLKIDFEFDIEGEYALKIIDVDANKEIQRLTFKSEVNTPSGRYEMAGNKIRVASGEYRIEISGRSSSYSDEEYEFEVNYDSESSDNYEKESNNTAKTAMFIDYNRKVIGNLESRSDTDFFMVELDNPGTIQIELKYDNSARYNVNLYSESNGKLNKLQSSKFEAGLVSDSSYSKYVTDRVRVPDGNYYIEVNNGFFSFNTDEDYELKVIYSRDRYGNFEEESNDSTTNATSIYESDRFTGNLSSKSDVDYYYIDLYGEKYYINMELPENSEYNVIIYKEENGRLKQISSKRIAGTDTYVEIDEAGGRYYIKVSSRTYSNEDYTIAVLREDEFYIPKVIELEENSQYMIVNGKKITIDGNRGTKPVVVNGRMLLPASAIVENLGGKVTWNGEARVATFELKNRVITMPIGSTVAYVNGQVKYLDVPTTTINSRTMVPVRFVTENLGCDVVWDNGKVTIKY